MWTLLCQVFIEPIKIYILKSKTIPMPCMKLKKNILLAISLNISKLLQFYRFMKKKIKHLNKSILNFAPYYKSNWCGKLIRQENYLCFWQNMFPSSLPPINMEGVFCTEKNVKIFLWKLYQAGFCWEHITTTMIGIKSFV